MQKDPDAYPAFYNQTPPHQGRNMKGRKPQPAFKDGQKWVRPDTKAEERKQLGLTPGPDASRPATTVIVSIPSLP